MSIRLNIQNQVRSGFYPPEEEPLGQRLMGLLVERLKSGARPPRPALFLFSADLVQVVDLVPLLRSGIDCNRAIASFSTLEGVEAMALVAIMDRRAPGRPLQRVAATFLEQADGRWWMAAQALDEKGQLEEELQFARASEGAAKPRGLGGWFSLARFYQLKIRLDPIRDEMVH